MPEREKERAVLVGTGPREEEFESSLEELHGLALSAGAEVVGVLTQIRQTPDAASLIGSGKLKELAALCAERRAEIAIFDAELSPTQQRNIEEALKVRTIDRTALILDIFAARARTSEGRLQVELAQLQYRLPRLAGQGTALSRLGGGIGTRGPGETQLETDRRHIRRRIQALKAQLAAAQSRRERLLRRRRKDGLPTCALVGYTNAGKSSLMNRLTASDVLAENKLFATLDTTARRLALPDGRAALLTDTVGFIRGLPHQLIDAFRATLEEVVAADVIIHVCDAASASLSEQAEVTDALLSELGCGGTPTVAALNKSDLLAPNQIPNLPGRECVPVSAATGVGVPELLAAIVRLLPERRVHVRASVPFRQAALLTRLRAEGQVLREEYRAEGVQIEALLEERTLRALRDAGVEVQESGDRG